jgi:quinone-modifying oxidoreductase subunit QmoA
MTEEQTTPAASGSILVVGGGISGLTTALEAAEVGYEVFLVEKNPYLGGRVAQLNQYFPKLCPPTCGLEINFRRIKDNPRVKVLTLSEVEKVDGTPGNYNVAIKVNPRYVNENCTLCGDCAAASQTEIDSQYDFGMKKNKGAYLPFEMAFPSRFVISPEVIGTEDAGRIKEACKYDAVDLDMEAKTLNLNVGSIVWATGYKPDFSWIKFDVAGNNGWPKTKRGISENFQGLYFVGMVFQYGLTSGLVGGVGRDAKFVTDHLHKVKGKESVSKQQLLP